MEIWGIEQINKPRFGFVVVYILFLFSMCSLDLIHGSDQSLNIKKIALLYKSNEWDSLFAQSLYIRKRQLSCEQSLAFAQSQVILLDVLASIHLCQYQRAEGIIQTYEKFLNEHCESNLLPETIAELKQIVILLKDYPVESSTSKIKSLSTQQNNHSIYWKIDPHAIEHLNNSHSLKLKVVNKCTS